MCFNVWMATLFNLMVISLAEVNSGLVQAGIKSLVGRLIINGSTYWQVGHKDVREKMVSVRNRSYNGMSSVVRASGLPWPDRLRNTAIISCAFPVRPSPLSLVVIHMQTTGNCAESWSILFHVYVAMTIYREADNATVFAAGHYS